MSRRFASGLATVADLRAAAEAAWQAAIPNLNVPGGGGANIATVVAFTAGEAVAWLASWYASPQERSWQRQRLAELLPLPQLFS